ncbi:MAG: DNA translocase FtsK [Lachnospiraceae bacterium]|nr:DNA translocase FtsK [Lachnospiraceae bacterium]
MANRNTGGKTRSSSSAGKSSGSSSKKSGTSKSRSGSSKSRTSTRTKSSSLADKEPLYSKPVYDEIKLLVALAVCIILLLSVFGLCGKLGDIIGYFMFGLFGVLAYTVPFIVFIGYAFILSNKRDPRVKVKIVAAVVCFVMILALITVTNSEYEESRSILNCYYESAASHRGGGLIGNIPAQPLCTALGKLGSTVIFIIVLLISVVLMSGRGIVTAIGEKLGSLGKKGGEKVKEAHEQMAVRREERREERLEQKRAEEEEKAKVSNGTRDYTFTAAPGKNAETPVKPAENEMPAAAAPAARELKATAIDADFEVIPEEEDEIAAGSLPKAIRISEEGPSIKTYGKTEEVPAEETAPQLKEQKAAADASAEPSEIMIPGFLRSEISRNSGSAAQTARTSGAFYVPELKAAENKYSGRTRTVPQKPDFMKSAEDLAEEAAGAEAALTGNEPAPDAKSEPVGEITIETEAPENTVKARKYEFPPIELLDIHKDVGGADPASLRNTSEKLQATFESFNVGVTITNVTEGPTVTRYELLPDTGVKVQSILNLSDDIKLSLAVPDIRIEAPIPGKSAIGIEVPNVNKKTVGLRNILISDEAKAMFRKSKLGFAVGEDIGGSVIMGDIRKMPHLIIAGATGSGKSVCINCIIMSLIYNASPEDLRMIMIDPKMVELSVYNGIPHMAAPVVNDPKQAAAVLNSVVETMMNRYKRFAQVGAKDIGSYNERVAALPADSGIPKMPYIVVIIDELADLMMVAKNDVEDAIVRLTQLARAAGIHLIIATQRPSVNVITGLIKANVPSRIAFAVSQGVDSRTIIDANGAEKLLGNGDMLYFPQGYTKPLRVQGAFVDEKEIKRVTDFVKDQTQWLSLTNDEINTDSRSGRTASQSSSGERRDGRDEYFEEAGKFVIEKQKASIGMLQRVYRIGFNRAARIMDQLCDAGVVGPEIGTKPREIHMTMEEFQSFLNSQE